MPEITEEATGRVFTNAKNNKAPGTGKIRMALQKCTGEKEAKYIRKLFNKIETRQQIPIEKHHSYITPIYTKRDKKICSNYTGITVLPLMTRFFSRVIKSKMK